LERTNSLTKHRKVSDASNSHSGGERRRGFDPDGIQQHQQHQQRHTGYGERLDQAESDAEMDYGFSQQDDEFSTKVPLVSYKSKGKASRSGKGKDKVTTTTTTSRQDQRRDGYGRISNDSLHSGTSFSLDEEDDNDLNFGQEEEDVGMMTGQRTNRSGIGNNNNHHHHHGHDHHSMEAKLPDQGGSLFNSFLNMANSIIGA
ncbi:hypothetical protein BGZ94_006301, partial [Podila epigama]